MLLKPLSSYNFSNEQLMEALTQKKNQGQHTKERRISFLKLHEISHKRILSSH